MPIFVKNQGPSRRASRLALPLTTWPPRQIKEKKPVAPIKTLVAIGQNCVGVAGDSLFVVVYETDYSPRARPSVSCLFGLSVCDSVGDRPSSRPWPGVFVFSLLLRSSSETVNLWRRLWRQFAEARSIQTPKFELSKVRSSMAKQNEPIPSSRRRHILWYDMKNSISYISGTAL